MRKKIIRDENRWLLEAITEEHETIFTHTGKIPKIEIDILMENVRKFYENLRILQRLDDSHLSGEQVDKPTIAAKEYAVKPEEKSEAFQSPAKPDEQLPKSLEPIEKPAEPIEQPAKRTEFPPSLKRPVKTQEIDLFAQEDQLHNMKLQDARERAFIPKIHSSKIENLKSAISINEKFMFINDLFEGNLREYNETIEALNGFISLDQAADYLNLMKQKNLWNTGSTAFLKLKELVERRF
ncbi:MAG: hypothetical protein NT004_14895 [Bacteroidetes bacterium]|nr:hypothetical protein [Bacteroidota bacterium]